MASEPVGAGRGTALGQRLSFGVIPAVLALLVYVGTTLALPWAWDTQYCCEGNSFAVGASKLIYGAPLGTMWRRVSDRFLLHPERPLGQILVDLQPLPEPKPGVSDTLFRTTYDGNGIGYPLVATAAFALFGLHAWAPLLAMLLLMGVAAAAFLRRFGGALAIAVTLYFVSLTLLLFTAIVWEPLFRTQIPVGGIRYFSLVAVLPTLHILLHLFAPEAAAPGAQRRDRALLGVQAAVLTIAVLVRGSAATLFGAIAIAWLVRLRRSGRRRPLLHDAAVIGAVVAGLWITLVLAMPRQYWIEGRIGSLVWHRVVVSLGLNPAFPFPGLDDMFADCRKIHPEGLHQGLLDLNGECIWDDYQLKHGVSVARATAFDLSNAQYETILRQQFWAIARRYPKEVLATFFYYKPQLLLQSLGTALATNFANDATRVATQGAKDYAPYSGLALALLMAALAVGAVHLAIAASVPTGLAGVAGVALWSTLWTIPPYLVAWPNPMTIADLTCYCLLLTALALGAVAAFAWQLARRCRRALTGPG